MLEIIDVSAQTIFFDVKSVSNYFMDQIRYFMLIVKLYVYNVFYMYIRVSLDKV